MPWNSGPHHLSSFHSSESRKSGAPMQGTAQKTLGVWPTVPMGSLCLHILIFHQGGHGLEATIFSSGWALNRTRCTRDSLQGSCPQLSYHLKNNYCKCHHHHYMGTLSTNTPKNCVSHSERALQWSKTKRLQFLHLFLSSPFYYD